MGVTVTGKLNKAAHRFLAGESVGFGIRIGQQYYDRKTKQKEWTNYKAVIFAKNPNMIAFLQGSLVEGSVVEVTGDTQAIEVYDGQNGQVLSIEIHNAKLGFVHSPEQPAQQASPATAQQASPAQQAYAAPAQQAPANYAPQQQASVPAQQAAASASKGGMEFDDDVPF